MPNSDQAWDVVLRNGSTLQIRRAVPADAPRIVRLYESLSPESAYLRFFSVPPKESAAIRALSRVDGVEHVALLAESRGQLVGVAEYFRDATERGRAEVAFAIIDALQGRGVGTRLLELLAEVARAAGIHRFVATVLAANLKMLDVFLDSGFEAERYLDQGGVHVSLNLAPGPSYQAQLARRGQQAAAASLHRFFEPRTVAVLGASRQPQQIGAQILKNLRNTGFNGELFPVNPNATEIDSLRCYSNIKDIHRDIDLAIIVVPAAAVSRAVDDCIEKGVRGILIISAGFAETGAEGRAREAALVEKVRSAGIRMIGPNCLGLLNTDPDISLNATFAPVFPPAGRVAFASQSGALGLSVLENARRLGLGISTFVAMGNKADISGNDLIQYWENDPRTDVILLYLESFGNARTFSRLARRVSRAKPIVAVKAGRSSVGARAASSHTGALAASDAAVDGLFHQAGIVRARSLSELFDLATLFAHQPVPAGRRVAVLTNAGGPGILAADACEAERLELPSLSAPTVAALRALLPAAASVANPVDMLAAAGPEQYREAMKRLLADPQIDSLLVIYVPPLVTEPTEVAAAIADGARAAGAKPVLASFMTADGPPPSLAQVPCYPFPEPAVVALSRAATYGAWRRRPAEEPPCFTDIDGARVRGIVDGALGRGGGWLTPLEAQALVEAAGIRVARARFAVGADAAVAAARAIGFPVAIKAAGPSIVHKTEVGGVKLGLTDEASVHRACLDLEERLGSRLSGVLVQEMVEGGVEIMAGALDDPTFGPLIAYGSGGTVLELLGDVAFRLQPLTDGDAREMLESVRGTALLRGYRGAPPADEAAVRAALLRLSALVELAPEIRELDANPIRVFPSGLRAVDVRVRIERPMPKPPSRRIQY
jgi:acetyl coenzyme A synthetase (ADP forming)-like protein